MKQIISGRNPTRSYFYYCEYIGGDLPPSDSLLE